MSRVYQRPVRRPLTAVYSLTDLLTLRNEAQAFLDGVQRLPGFVEVIEGLPIPPSGLDRSLSDARRDVAAAGGRGSSDRAARFRDTDGWTEYIVRVEDAGAVLMCDAQWSARALHDAIRNSVPGSGGPALAVPSTLATRAWVLGQPVEPGPSLEAGRALSERELAAAIARLDRARTALFNAALDGVEGVGGRVTYADVNRLRGESEAEVNRLRGYARTAAEVTALEGTTNASQGDEVQLETVARLQGDRRQLWSGAESAVGRRLAGDTVPPNERSAVRHAREYLNAAVNGAKFAPQPVDPTDPVTPAARRAARTDYLKRLQELHRRAQTRVRLSARSRR